MTCNGGNLANRLQIPAATIAALLLVALVVVAVQTDWRMLSGQDLEKAQVIQTGSVSILASPSDVSTLQQAGFTTEEQQSEAQQAGLADLLIKDYVLPFEAVSLLLLAAAIGALVLVRPR